MKQKCFHLQPYSVFFSGGYAKESVMGDGEITKILNYTSVNFTSEKRTECGMEWNELREKLARLNYEL